MEQIIQQLIDARKKANMSLTELQQRTKISLRQLEALERGDYDQIGPTVYLKGFIRRYAQEVGLDADQLMASKQPEPLLEKAVHKSPRPRRQLDLMPILKVVFVLGIAILAVFLIRSAVLTWMEPAPNPPPLPPVSDDDQPGNDDPTQPDPEPEPKLPATEINLLQFENRVAVYEVLNADSLELLLEVAGGNCWVNVGTDDNARSSETLRAGQERSWSAEDYMYIRLGAPRFVTIHLFDIEVEIPDDRRAITLEFRLQE